MNADPRSIIRNRVSDLHARSEQAAELALTIKNHLLPEIDDWLERCAGNGLAILAQRHVSTAGILLGLLADLCGGADAHLEEISAAEQLLPDLLPCGQSDASI